MMKRKIDWTNLNCIERRLSRFFELYSALVFRHPWKFILIPTVIGIGLSSGFFFKHDSGDATYLYTPLAATSKYERRCILEKWPLVDGRYIPGKAVDTVREGQSIVMAKDGGNVLRTEIQNAIYRLNLFVIDKIKVRANNRTYTYQDLCLRWDDTCYTNAQVNLVSTLYNNPDPTWVNLTYPMATIGSSTGYLASSLGGVETDPSTGLIKSAQAWILLYQLQFEQANVSRLSGLWEMEFQRQLLKYTDPFIRLTVYHSQTLTLELKRNAEKLLPRFAICFLILVIFAMLVTFSTVSFPYIDWAVSKPLLALFGVVGAGMGIGTTIGLLAYCGYVYNQIVSVMPFLIIAVRLDNTFIMISALRHVSRSLPAEKRITESMSQAASAITVTVSTDFFSFLAGIIPILTDIPAVIIFCLYTSLAVLITFLFQMTFLMGLLVLAAKNEEKGLNSMLMCVKTVPPKEAKERGLFTRLFNQGTHAHVQTTTTAATATASHNSQSTVQHHDSSSTDPGLLSRFFSDWYAPILTHPIIKGLVLAWFVLYLVGCSYLCTQMRQGLEPVKLLVRDSYAIPHYKLLEAIFWRNGSEMQLVVNNAPDLSNRSQVDRVKRMVQEFASTAHSMGPSSVQFWLYDFERYMDQSGVGWTIHGDHQDPTTSCYYSSVRRFLSLSTYEKSRQDVVWADPSTISYANFSDNGDNNNVSKIASFRLSIGLTRFQNAELQMETVDLMRALARDPRWSDMNITTFNPGWLFVDQYEEILPNVLQEVIFGVSFMVLIALLLIPHPLTSFWVAINIFSVDLGVIGFMTVWDINLDTISMITIMMSIGFSVDFSAHMAHAFVCASNPSDTPEVKVRKALGEVGWPIVQGALSTLLGVVVLSDLESYMVVAFFKTVFLVIILAVVHGLIFLPVILSIFAPTTCRCCSSRKRKTTADQQINKITTDNYDNGGGLHQRPKLEYNVNNNSIINGAV